MPGTTPQDAPACPLAHTPAQTRAAHPHGPRPVSPLACEPPRRLALAHLQEPRPPPARPSPQGEPRPPLATPGKGVLAGEGKQDAGTEDARRPPPPPPPGRALSVQGTDHRRKGCVDKNKGGMGVFFAFFSLVFVVG
ncbi:hypothetical protein U9M48_020511 [Paspalum notatum var. saurae]|uniref:Uncharacterized protein n=1 Tax=Paspalum notatum var. saurae TaxID=547442 RepID=A0AAQ3TEX7_PASNO